jgi:lipopolysaccharide transport system permease protein
MSGGESAAATKLADQIRAGTVSTTTGGVGRELPVTHITAHRGLFDWRLGQLWRYRDLIKLFVWRDFVSLYKQTVLGPAWHVLRPVMATLILTVVFGRIARLSTDGTPPFLFYMAGQVAWAFFANCLDGISRTFVSNAHLLGKVYFHRLAVPVAAIFSNLISFGIQFAVLLVVLAAHIAYGSSVHFTGWVLALPLVLLLLGGYALAIGLVVCALTTRFRDLTYLMTFGTQLLMYVSPVIYPVSTVPEQYQWFIRANPLTPVLEAFRRAVLGTGSVMPVDLLVSAGVMLVALVVGLMLFTRVERTFLDTV